MSEKKASLEQDINDEMFTTFKPEEELWIAAGTKSPTGTRGRDGSSSDTDFDFDAN